MNIRTTKPKYMSCLWKLCMDFYVNLRTCLSILDGLFSLWEYQYCGLVQTSPQLVGKEIILSFLDDT